MQFTNSLLLLSTSIEGLIESKIGMVSQRHAQLLVGRSSLQAAFVFLALGPGDADESCEFFIDTMKLVNGDILSLPQDIDSMKIKVGGVANSEPVGIKTNEVSNTGEWRITVTMARNIIGLNEVVSDCLMGMATSE